MTYSLAEVEDAVAQFRADLHDLQRRMDPLVDQYEDFRRIKSEEDERMYKALSMVWNAWWDIAQTVAYLRAADRRLRDGDGIPADAETER